MARSKARMILLADGERTARALAPVAVAPAATPKTPPIPSVSEAAGAGTVADLAGPERAIWEAAGTGTAVWRQEVPVPAELGTWRHAVLVAEASGSQFDALRRFHATPASAIPAGDRPVGGIACIAQTGVGFHGHRARTWRAQPGNLHLSAACDPDLPARTCGLAMTALPAVALVEALQACGTWRTPPGIKWVNDVLLGGHKVGGVLTATQSVRGRLSTVVFGIGLNVAHTPDVPASAFVPAVGSLPGFAVGEPPGLRRCLAACLVRVGAWLARCRAEGPGPLLDAYRRHSLVIGREVEIWEDEQPETAGRDELPPPSFSGRVEAIANDLSLQLAGTAAPVTRGRLVLVDAAVPNTAVPDTAPPRPRDGRVLE